MATKKDSIQEERSQNVSAPQSEPGAANMTIPRRDLLTGAALVLVGSASGCGDLKGAGAGAGKQPPLRSQFMADFTAAFIGDPGKIDDPDWLTTWPDPPKASAGPPRLWPVQGQFKNDVVIDYATFVDVLMKVGYVKGPPPVASSGSLGARIVQFLQAQNWPSKTQIPVGYEKKQDTVHLVEIAVILDRLLQAMNSFKLAPGPGGGGSNWPPH